MMIRKEQKEEMMMMISPINTDIKYLNKVLTYNSAM
jgi:hypothetical protein